MARMSIPDLSSWPLCTYFLSRYLSKNSDPTNFPPDQFPQVFDRYEQVFEAAINVLRLPKEALKGRSEFNFDSGDAANLEGGIAILRVVEALRMEGFNNIRLIKPTKNASGADLICDKNGQNVCCEVKAITKQSSGREGFFYEDQLYEKILESISKARIQLATTSQEMQCTVTMFVCVVNWFAQSIYLGQPDYQHIVNKLELDGEQESLKGIDAVLFVTKMGQRFLFLNEHGKCIDR